MNLAKEGESEIKRKSAREGSEKAKEVKRAKKEAGERSCEFERVQYKPDK